MVPQPTVRDTYCQSTTARSKSGYVVISCTVEKIAPYETLWAVERYVAVSNLDPCNGKSTVFVFLCSMAVLIMGCLKGEKYDEGPVQTEEPTEYFLNGATPSTRYMSIYPSDVENPPQTVVC